MADVKLSAGRKALQTSLFDAQNRMMHDIQRGIGRMFVYAQMPVSKAQEVLSQRWLGGNYSGRVWTDTQKLAQEMQTCVMENMMAGKTSEQTYQNLLDLCGQDMRKTNRLIRTETSFVANQGEKYAYEQANIKEYEFVSALEARTCEICGGLDGKRFPVNASKPGKNFPPMHPHCRCTTMLYDKDLEAILTDEDTRWARDPETGKAYEVPMSMTYEEWKKKQQEVSGIDSVEIARKKLYNRAADIKQMEKYQARLGKKNVPQTLDAFQKIKYNDNASYSVLKEDYRYSGMLEKRAVFSNASLPNGLAIVSNANSISDKVDDDGNVLQRRIYDENGKASVDIDSSDHNRSDLHPTGAHKHVFSDDKKPRGKPQSLNDLEIKRNADMIRKGGKLF